MEHEVMFNLGRHEDKQRLLDLIRNIKGYRWVSIQKATRSSNWNAYYWKVVLELIYQHTGQNKKELHTYFCCKFIPEFDRSFTHGETLRPGHTSKMTQERFNDYVMQVQMFASEFLQIYIPDPGEIVAY